MNKSILVFLAALLWSQSAAAGGYELFEQSASSAGVGGAAAARADDSSAAWHNPAALADGKGLRASLGLTLVSTGIRATESDLGWDIDSDAGMGSPFYGYLSFAHEQWALGLSVNVPYASNVSWPTDGAQRFEIIQSKPNFVRFAPFLAWSFGELRIAAGPHLDVGTLELLRNLDFIDIEGAVQIRMRGVGFGGHAAAYWEHEQFSLGLTYKSRTIVSLDGQAAFEAPVEFAGKTQDQNSTAVWRNPDRITLGAGLAIDELQIFAEASFTLWSINEEFVVDFERDATPDRVQRNEWNNTLSLRLGAEYRVIPALSLRGGLVYDASPIPARNLVPSSPDSDRLGGALGVGLYLEGFQIDAFYQMLRLLGETSTSADAPPARYDGFAHFVGVGVGWSFDPRDAASR